MTGTTGGFGKPEPHADDELVRNEDEFAKLRDLALVPDPPAILVCNICKKELVKNADTMGSWCHDQPMTEWQRDKSVDQDILKRIFEMKSESQK